MHKGMGPRILLHNQMSQSNINIVDIRDEVVIQFSQGHCTHESYVCQFLLFPPHNSKVLCYFSYKLYII